ncbi:MAG: DNA repair protein RadA [Ardenticatenales bacterium]|nr:DNA repair protein RadA [Ardenticatenales bacterium]
MAKAKIVYVCSECGASQPRWAGQCDACRAWNTLREMRAPDGDRRGPVRGPLEPSHALPLSAIDADAAGRLVLPIGELNRLLGGGIVPGSVILLGGEPGIGKSTLVLQAAALLAEVAGPVLYVSGEESAQQLKLRAERLGLTGDRLYVLSETNLDAVLSEIDRLSPGAVVVDSIQTVYVPEVTSTAGSVTQVRESAAKLMRVAKALSLPMILIGHVTKSGDLAGPRVLEHMVDVVLQLEGDRYHSYRLLRSVKNRFGSTNDVGVFEMRGEGMVEIPNPSEVFLAERLAGAPGSCVTVTMEGTRPLLVEVQALVSQVQGQVPPRRMANGIDTNRLLLLVAVLAKRFGMPLGNADVFVNVVGGMHINEPALDLAVALAIVSSGRGAPVADDLVILGEIGLSGELRSVGQIERRLAEAAKFGYKRALVPKGALGRKLETGGLKAIGARTLGEALDAGVGGREERGRAD